MSKGAKDYSGGELRERANATDPKTHKPARRELNRRRDNLRGAVVPAWEREARGGDPADWKLW